MATIDRDRVLKWLGWLPALYAAHIMLWYEQFKLTGAEGSVMLFNILADWLWISGYGKPFRLSVAIAELTAALGRDPACHLPPRACRADRGAHGAPNAPRHLTAVPS